MNFVVNYYTRFKRNICISGYRKITQSNKIGMLRRVQESLVDCHFDAIDNYALDKVYNASKTNAELITRQFLLQRHSGTKMNDALLYSIGNESKIVYPLPKEWRETLKENGFQIDTIKSMILWVGLIALYFGYGVLFIGRCVINSLSSIFIKRSLDPGKYAYFENLTPGNLPQPDKTGNSYDIVSWYSKWDGCAKDLSSICHGVQNVVPTIVGGIRVECIDPPFKYLYSFKGLIQFILWGVVAIPIAAIDALRGRWWHALILAEAAKAKVVQLTDPDALACDYLFHYSGTIYKPMWTYETEKIGSRIICYFYSTSEQVKLPGGYESQRYEWGAASWPHYLVWDHFQAEMIRRDIDLHASIHVVGPIWFSTSSDELPEIPERSIAVFDIQPQNETSYRGFTTLADYVVQNPKLHIDFLNDIKDLLSDLDVTMVFKRKREIDKKRTVKEYAELVKKFSESNDVIMINPSISPIKVMEKCKGVISMPFTSTALYMRDQGIPSIYYDPTGWIQKDDRGAHGIPIVSGIEELRGWFLSIFKNNI